MIDQINWTPFLRQALIASPHPTSTWSKGAFGRLHRFEYATLPSLVDRLPTGRR